MNAPLSNCCHAEMRVGGLGLTHWYICTKCQEACDAEKVCACNRHPDSVFTVKVVNGNRICPRCGGEIKFKENV